VSLLNRPGKRPHQLSRAVFLSGIPQNSKQSPNFSGLFFIFSEIKAQKLQLPNTLNQEF
jgi:hypothetical protein